MYLCVYVHRECTPSKVLCFTRSSPLIHQLPAQYPSQVVEPEAKEGTKQILQVCAKVYYHFFLPISCLLFSAHVTHLYCVYKLCAFFLQNLVHQNIDKLMVCKLSNVPSQSQLSELLHSFVHSDTAEVLLLIVNMQEVKQQIINHIRIMIEEEEALLRKESKQPKLFLLLLHFPPSKFHQACYPSLFLRGWDHCYLDTIAHSAVKGVIDIRSWFWDCCFSQEIVPPPEEDPLILALREILHESIPILSSRVYFGMIMNGHFNTTMSGSQRSKTLKTFLFDKGVGKVLCEKFHTYWKPNVMAEYLEKAVVFTRSQYSTLNITDSIQATFKNHFFDFLVYMISRINEDCNIDVLFSPDSSPAIEELFLNITQAFPVPKLSQLKVRSSHIQVVKQTHYLPQFPFFKMVSDVIERLVEESWEEANKEIDLLKGIERTVQAPPTYYGVTNQQSLQKKLKEIVIRKVEMIMEVGSLFPLLSKSVVIP